MKISKRLDLRIHDPNTATRQKRSVKYYSYSTCLKVKMIAVFLVAKDWTSKGLDSWILILGCEYKLIDVQAQVSGLSQLNENV